MADANWVIALCTAVLVGVTWYYASLSNRLTNRLVELQVEPSVEIGVAEPFQAATVVTLRNIGAQNVTDVSVNLRCFSFRDSDDTNPVTQFVGIPSGGEQRSWWFVRDLAPKAPLSKDAAGDLERFLNNSEKLATPRPSPMPRSAVHTGSLLLKSRFFLVVDVSYHRSTDYKSYEVSRPVWFARDANTGKPFLFKNPISTEYQKFLRELNGNPL